MPNEPRNKTGKSLREQLSAAAKATAEQQAARKNSKPKATKRRASKEQVEDAKKRGRKAERERTSIPEAIKDFLGNMGLPFRILLIFVVVFALAAVVLYPISCTYYQALRQEQKLQAELDAVNARNELLEAENKALETDEGIESQVRKEYGWTKKDEKATVVTNADDKSKDEMPTQVKSEDIEAPHTWYYDILDKLFRVKL